MRTNLDVKTKEYYGANLLEVSVGSNCPRGGDAGHGGRTYLRLTDNGGTAWEIRIEGGFFQRRDDSEGEIIYEDPNSIKIVLGGDSEADTFLNCLKFAVRKLEEAKESKKSEGGLCCSKEKKDNVSF